ncbi:thioesterase family protein [[Mycobacterium] wendilense]
MTGPASFARAMTLTAADPVDADGAADAVFTAELNLHWTIGPKIHGGVMLALCAKAAGLAITGGETGFAPVAVSASYLSAPDPGSVRLVARVRKRGRRVSLVDVELIQGQRVAVRTSVTLAEPEHDAAPLLAANPVPAQMPPEPPAGIEAIGPGHPLAEINHLAAGCDIRPDMSQLWTPTPGQAPVTRLWVRPRTEVPDVLFALMCGDISMPVTFAVGRTGWAPTIQLTAYLRGLPADGWLRILCTTTQIGQDWFDEDHLVVDSTGRIVVQTRQLAMVPAP